MFVKKMRYIFIFLCCSLSLGFAQDEPVSGVYNHGDINKIDHGIQPNTENSENKDKDKDKSMKNDQKREYKVVARQVRDGNHDKERPITKLKVEDDKGNPKIFEIPEVIERITAGEIFYTEFKGDRSNLEVVAAHVRAKRDGTSGNNLSELPLFVD